MHDTASTPASRPSAAAPAPDARELQARLYREIGISAVAAALRFASQPDPDKAKAPVDRATPALLRDEDLAA